MEAIEAKLAGRGLVVDRARVVRARRGAIPLAAVLVLGIARLAAGIDNHKPVGYLFALLIVPSSPCAAPVQGDPAECWPGASRTRPPSSPPAQTSHGVDDELEASADSASSPRRGGRAGRCRRPGGGRRLGFVE